MDRAANNPDATGSRAAKRAAFAKEALKQGIEAPLSMLIVWPFLVMAVFISFMWPVLLVAALVLWAVTR